MAKPDILLHALLGFFFLVTLIWILLHSCSLTFHCGERFSLQEDPVAYKHLSDSAFDTEASPSSSPLRCPPQQRPWLDAWHQDPLVREN